MRALQSAARIGSKFIRFCPAPNSQACCLSLINKRLKTHQQHQASCCLPGLLACLRRHSRRLRFAKIDLRRGSPSNKGLTHPMHVNPRLALAYWLCGLCKRKCETQLTSRFASPTISLCWRRCFTVVFFHFAPFKRLACYAPKPQQSAAALGKMADDDDVCSSATSVSSIGQRATIAQFVQ